MRDPEKLFADAIIGWHEACGRHDLPWQVEDWYPRLVSEVMLQQTQVVSVLPKYEAFMTAFPTPECLAAAPDDDVMALWAGLGYYSRARNLLKAVRIIVNEMGGRCPETAAELEKLPGLGPSTAGAVAAFAFRERAVMADGNAQRVLARVFMVEGNAAQPGFVKEIRTLAASLLPSSELMPTYTQALMDFGAMLCKRNPDCGACPLADCCGARLAGRVADFPGRKPRRERPVRHAVMVFAFAENGLWLRRRTEKGVWHGLWTPPLRQQDEPVESADPLSVCPELEGGILRTIRLEPLVHDFTHYRLIIHSVAVDLAQGFALEGFELLGEKETASVGMPTPVVKLLTICREERDFRPLLF